MVEGRKGQFYQPAAAGVAADGILTTWYALVRNRRARFLARVTQNLHIDTFYYPENAENVVLGNN
jgi:hypothetical protein